MGKEFLPCNTPALLPCIFSIIGNHRSQSNRNESGSFHKIPLKNVNHFPSSTIHQFDNLTHRSLQFEIDIHRTIVTHPQKISAMPVVDADFQQIQTIEKSKTIP